MITEKMLELLVVKELIKEVKSNDPTYFKLLNRYNDLLQEFLDYYKNSNIPAD